MHAACQQKLLLPLLPLVELHAAARKNMDSSSFDQPVFFRCRGGELAIMPLDSCKLICRHCLVKGPVEKAVFAASSFGQHHGDRCKYARTADEVPYLNQMKELSLVLSSFDDCRKFDQPVFFRCRGGELAIMPPDSFKLICRHCLVKGKLPVAKAVFAATSFGQHHGDRCKYARTADEVPYLNQMKELSLVLSSFDDCRKFDQPVFFRCRGGELAIMPPDSFKLICRHCLVKGKLPVAKAVFAATSFGQHHGDRCKYAGRADEKPTLHQMKELSLVRTT